MVVYNVTVSIDEAVALEWLEWMRKKYVPEIMETGLFKECKLCRVHGEEAGGLTYAVMYTAFSIEHLENFNEHFEPRLQSMQLEKFKGRYVDFKTMLSVIEEF